jgi:hypothetical protein
VKTVEALESVKQQNLIEKDGKRNALAAVVSAKREVRHDSSRITAIPILLFALAHLFPSPAKSLITHLFYLPSSSLPAVVEAFPRDDGEAGASHSRGRGFPV